MPSNLDLSIGEHESGQLENSISVKLPKKQGESAIQLLARLNLLNRKLVPLTTTDTIFLPLVRAPKPKEQGEFEDAFGRQVLSNEMFRIRSKTIGSFDDILAEKIPRDVVPLVSKSFDIIGDIAIIELFPPADQYERTIADALTQVHKTVRTVYSKAGPITDNLRLRPLHLVLGENRSETIHKEHGCRFKVDVSKAFFSPRLSSEHKRIAYKVTPDETVVDMFAGVGPFSVLIAKRLEKGKVHSIDANPEAARLIEENARLNRVQDKITVWSGDAHNLVRKNLFGLADRVIMNHPSEAKNFLEDAARAIKPSGGTLHYYTFADGEDCETKARGELIRGLSNSKWEIEETTVHRVRGVAPMKWQVVVDARLVPA
jgi:tRNA (guanine37-N1)-methyltransferase